MNSLVDLYLTEGCGRCPLYRTPECKAIRWHQELRLLRQFVLEAGLIEELKWSMPTYTHRGKNVIIVSAFRDYVSVAFFKGTLLQDEAKRLVSAGPNSQSSMQLRYTAAEAILQDSELIPAYVREAMTLEESGAKVAFKNPADHERPQELEDRLDAEPALRAAFEALSPGKRRGYLLHIAGAKQSETRAARVERCIPKILAGKAYEDRS